MKGRSFLLALAATAMVLLTLALGVWWAMARQSPLRLVDQPLALPRAARFMPRDAALTLHWLVDPRQVPAYAQAVAPVRQRRLVNESTRQLRDGAFALAGLDFSSELAGWIGPEVSLAVLQAPSPQVGAPPADGWVLALSSRDEDGAKRFLQRFWQTRSLAGTNLQISRYRGMGLISGRGALLGRDPQPIATALIDDDLLLLASGRGVLEQALDVSQLDSQHQLGDPELLSDLQRFGRGAAILTAKPAAMDRWLGVPSAITSRPDLEGMVAVLSPQSSDLVTDAVVRFREAVIPLAAKGSEADALLRSAGGDADALAVLADPAAVIASESDGPMAQWIAPVIQQSLASSDSPAAAAVIGLDDGPLLWQQGGEGWILGTPPIDPSPIGWMSAFRTLDCQCRPWRVTDNRCRSGPVWPDSVVMVRRPSRLNWPWRWNANPVCLGGERRWMACVIALTGALSTSGFSSCSNFRTALRLRWSSGLHWPLPPVAIIWGSGGPGSWCKGWPVAL